MNQSAADQAWPLGKWQKIGELPFRTEPGYEEEVLFVIQQMLSRLKLPVAVLEKLRTSVYNTFSRIGALKTNSEVLVLVFIAARSWALDPDQGQDSPNEQAERAVAAAGWGYFLVERRCVACEERTETRHIVELYCYQEGQ